jgi:hypothetical protein
MSNRKNSDESRYIVETHVSIHVQHHLQAFFRESNRERYHKTNVAAKTTTVRAKKT